MKHILKTTNKLNELNSPDNIYLTPNNNLLVAEDSPSNDYLEIWLLEIDTSGGFPTITSKNPIVRLNNRKGSEISGLAMVTLENKQILMFSSQQGELLIKE